MCAVVTMQVYESRVDFKARLTFRTLIPCSEMTILQQDTFVFSRKLQQSPFFILSSHLGIHQ